MPSTNGHGSKRAILYARVSTDEQARSGYSLGQQLEALRAYCQREGYEIFEEVQDPGQSGASLERPGMDRVRDLVAAGGVSVILAQDRDRFAREPAYHYLLRREFEEHGTKIRALNDRGDDSPEGELTDGILDQLAKFERAKTAERSRRGKLAKARQGKIIAKHTPNYGFQFNEGRDNYVVDEGTMPIVHRIFRMIGVEGSSIRRVKHTLERDGVRVPSGKSGKLGWDTTFIRHVVLNDIYKPHTYREIAELVSSDVAARLDRQKCYGVWWFNRERIVRRRIVEYGQNGREYRYRTTRIPRPNSEWIAVPVPDAGVPRDVVERAREAIKDNRPPSSAGHRHWQLSGRILYCGECGRSMTPRTSRGGSNRPKLYCYYACLPQDRAACSNRKKLRAQETEDLVWEVVRNLLTHPEQLRSDLEEMIEHQRRGIHGNPNREAKAWLQKIDETDRMRSNYQEMAARSLITFDELEEKLGQLDETRATAERELAALSNQQEAIEALERDKDALLDSYAGMAPEALDTLTPEERRQVYKMLKLRVTAFPDARLEVGGVLTSAVGVCSGETRRG
jgi:site-specific DNA recombinase